eukprot:gene1011-7173_t
MALEKGSGMSAAHNRRGSIHEHNTKALATTASPDSEAGVDVGKTSQTAR